MPAVEELDSSRRKLKTIFLMTEEKYVNPEGDQERHACEQELSGVRKKTQWGKNKGLQRCLET